MAEESILQVNQISKAFGKQQVLKKVSLTVERGEIFGLVGESGCGKSTLANIVLRLSKEDEGTVFYRGQNITDYDFNKLIPLRKGFQGVFQDTTSSLNPRMKAGDIIMEPLINYKLPHGEGRLFKLLDAVGLERSSAHKKPNEFSGGQRQRIAIARAMALSPDFIVMDEPTSSLDTITAREIINILKSLNKEYKTAYLFISHDNVLVKEFCHRVVTMKSGEIINSEGCK